MFNKITPRKNEFYNLMDDFFNGSFAPIKYDNEPMFKIDIQDLDDSYLVEAELPGYEKDEIDVKFENDNLIISVNKDEKIDKSDVEKNYIHKERKTSSMRRVMSFNNVDESKIKAKLNNGILEIKIPKGTDDEKTKTISIE